MITILDCVCVCVVPSGLWTNINETYRLMQASPPTAALYPWWCARRCRCRRPRLRSKPEPLFQRCLAIWWWHGDGWSPGSVRQKHTIYLKKKKKMYFKLKQFTMLWVFFTIFKFLTRTFSCRINGQLPKWKKVEGTNYWEWSKYFKEKKHKQCLRWEIRLSEAKMWYLKVKTSWTRVKYTSELLSWKTLSSANEGLKFLLPVIKHLFYPKRKVSD